MPFAFLPIFFLFFALAGCETPLNLKISPIVNLKKPVTLAHLKSLGAKLVFVLEESDSTQWVAALPLGTVVNEGGILTQEGCILQSTKTSSRDQHGLMNPRRNLEKETPLRFQGRLAVISSPGSENWYHWLLQVLPRLIILQKSGVAYDRIYINNLQHVWQKESLSLVLSHLEIDPEKILTINGDAIVQASELIVPSVPFIPNVRVGEPIPLWLKEELHRIFLRKPKNQPTSAASSKKIYIARRKASIRRISNEVQLIQKLKAKGFKAVFLEDLSPFEQAYLFHEAEVIVGPHGSGFANLIFARPGCVLVEIDHGIKPEPRSFYKRMAHLMGCSYVPFYVDQTTEDHLEDDMDVDISKLMILLDQQ